MKRFAAALLAAACLALPARAEPVDLELVLAVDVSGSVDSYEHDVQRRGYSEAFRDPRVLDAIRSGRRQKIAVTMVEWAGVDQQRQIVPWTLVSDSETAEGFAAAILTPGRMPGRWTSISGAIDFSLPLFDNNGFEGDRLVIDVSGDGVNNSGRPAPDARDSALAKGVTVNGLAILNDRPNPFGGTWAQQQQSAVPLDEYYQDNVIGGFGAFLISTNDFNDFPRAIIQKLIREIAQRDERLPPGFAQR